MDVFLRIPPPERAGLGNIMINGRHFEDYFKPILARMEVMKPFELTGTLGGFDVKANISGGGFSGQAAVNTSSPPPFPFLF
jgi:ribosomal protein S9